MMGKSLEGDPVRHDRILARMLMAHLGAARAIRRATFLLYPSVLKLVTGAMLPVGGGVSVGTQLT